MDEVITIGLDIAKQVFHVHGADGSGRALFSRRISRARMHGFFASQPRCVVAMEACERTLRRLLIIGSSAVVLHASKRGAPDGSWLGQMMARKPRMLVTVAQANKTARIVWAVLARGEVYKAPVAAA